MAKYGARLLARARAAGVDVNHLRTQVAFERFLDRVFQMQAGWVLKSGYVLEVRLQGGARSTLDLDLNASGTHDLLAALQAALLQAADHFEFSVRAQGAGRGSGRSSRGRPALHGRRPAGRTFTRFVVDPQVGDTLTQAPEWLAGQADLSFADLPRSRLRAYPMVGHFAEKVHAYTRPRAQRTRVKDLVDLALLLTFGLALDGATAEALRVTFSRYGTHPLPGTWPPAPRDWDEPFGRLAGQTGLETTDLRAWEARLAVFWTDLPSP